MRNMVSAASATPLTIVTWSKMASVSGSFLGLTLGHFLREIAQIIQFSADSFGRWQYGIRVAFVGDQLTPHLGRCQARIEAVGAELGVGLALAIDDGLDIRQEVGQMCFRPRRAKASTQLTPLSSSCRPLRMVIRPYRSSRAARCCPPGPSSLTVRAINKRRALPWSDLAVSISRVLSESVSSIGIPPV